MTTAEKDSVSESTFKGALAGLIIGFFGSALLDYLVYLENWSIGDYFQTHRMIVGTILGANFTALICYVSARGKLVKPVVQKIKHEPGKDLGTSFLQRAIWAVPAGMIAGVWVETLANEFAPVRGALWGALVAGVVSCVFQVANSQLLIDRYGKCLLAGMLAGVLWGVFWYSSSRYAEYLEQLKTKNEGTYQFVVSSTAGGATREGFVLQGLRYGIPVGAAAGLVLCFGIHIYCRRNSAVGDDSGSPG